MAQEQPVESLIVRGNKKILSHSTDMGCTDATNHQEMMNTLIPCSQAALI